MPAGSPIPILDASLYSIPAAVTRARDAILSQFDSWKGVLSPILSAATSAAQLQADAQNYSASVGNAAAIVDAHSGAWSIGAAASGVSALQGNIKGPLTQPFNGLSITVPDAAYAGEWLENFSHGQAQTAINELNAHMIDWSDIPLNENEQGVDTSITIPVGFPLE